MTAWLMELGASTVTICSAGSELHKKVKERSWKTGSKSQRILGKRESEEQMYIFKGKSGCLSSPPSSCGFSTFELAAGSTSVSLLMVIPNVSVIPLRLKRPSPPASSQITAPALKVGVALSERQCFTRLRRLQRFLRSGHHGSQQQSQQPAAPVERREWNPA